MNNVITTWDDDKSDSNFSRQEISKKSFGLHRDDKFMFSNEDAKTTCFGLIAKQKNAVCNNMPSGYRKTGISHGLELTRSRGTGDSLHNSKKPANKITAGATLSNSPRKVKKPDLGKHDDSDFEEWDAFKRSSANNAKVHDNTPVSSYASRPKSANAKSVANHSAGNADPLKISRKRSFPGILSAIKPLNLERNLPPETIRYQKSNIPEALLNKVAAGDSPAFSDDIKLLPGDTMTRRTSVPGMNNQSKAAFLDTKSVESTQLRKSPRDSSTRAAPLPGSSISIPIVLEIDDSNDEDTETDEEFQEKSSDDQTTIENIANITRIVCPGKVYGKASNNRTSFGHFEIIVVSAVYFGSAPFVPTLPISPSTTSPAAPAGRRPSLSIQCASQSLSLTFRRSGDWSLLPSSLSADLLSECIHFDDVESITFGSISADSTTKISPDKAQLYARFACFIAIDFQPGTSFEDERINSEIRPSLTNNTKHDYRKYLLLLLPQDDLDTFVKQENDSSCFSRGECLDELLMAVTICGGDLAQVVAALRGSGRRRSSRRREFADYNLTPEPCDDKVLFLYPMEPEAQDVVTIRQGDRRRLEPGKYLNDNLIDLQLRLILDEASKRNRDVSVHLFSCLFYAKLTEGSAHLSKKTGDHKLVERWTKAVNIFEKDFLLVPINESAHWSLAVVVNAVAVGVSKMNTSASSSKKRKRSGPGQSESGPRAIDSSTPTKDASTQSPAADDMKSPDVLNATLTPMAAMETERFSSPTPSEQSQDSSAGALSPCILFMDSLGMHRATVVADVLRRYLCDEWAARVGSAKLFDKSNLPLKICRDYIPRQTNAYDCGVYVIKYAEMICTHFSRATVKSHRLRPGVSSNKEGRTGSVTDRALPSDDDIIKEILRANSFGQDDVDDQRQLMLCTIESLKVDWTEKQKTFKQDKLLAKKKLLHPAEADAAAGPVSAVDWAQPVVDEARVRSAAGETPQDGDSDFKLDGEGRRAAAEDPDTTFAAAVAMVMGGPLASDSSGGSDSSSSAEDSQSGVPDLSSTDGSKLFGCEDSEHVREARVCVSAKVADGDHGGTVSAGGVATRDSKLFRNISSIATVFSSMKSTNTINDKGYF